MAITLPAPTETYDKENEAQTRRILEQSVGGDVDLSPLNTALGDLDDRVTDLENAPGALPKWELLIEEVLSTNQATPWTITLPANDATELLVDALVVGGTLTSATLAFRVGAADMTGRGRYLQALNTTLTAVNQTAVTIVHGASLSSTVHARFWARLTPELMNGFTANTSGTQNTAEGNVFPTQDVADVTAVQMRYTGTGQFASGSYVRVYGRNAA